MSVSAMVPNFAEIAVELQLAKSFAEFEQICFAVRLEANVSEKIRTKLELLAAEIDLDPDVTRNVLANWETRARLLGRAAAIFKNLIPHEELITRLAETAKRGRP